MKLLLVFVSLFLAVALAGSRLDNYDKEALLQMEEEVNKNVKITGCLTVLLNHIKNNGAPFLPKMEGAENLRRLYDKVVAHVALTCGSQINFDLAMEAISNVRSSGTFRQNYFYLIDYPYEQGDHLETVEITPEEEEMLNYLRTEMQIEIPDLFTDYPQSV